MSTTAPLDQALADLAAGRLPDEAGRRAIVEVVECSIERDAGLHRKARAERDRLIVEFANQYAAHLESARAKAALLDQIARRYQGGRWRYHRDRLRLPVELHGHPERFVWTILKTLGEFPGYEKIRKIL